MMMPEQRPGLIRKTIDVLFHQHASRAEVSLGVGIGVFIGLTPLYLMHAPLAALIAWALRVNIGAAVIGTQVANPFFAPGLIAASLWVGHLLGGSEGGGIPLNPADPSFWASWARGGLVLGVILGAVLGSLTYLAATIARRRRHA